MNDKIRRFPNKNLKMPESGVNFLMLIFLSKIDNMIYFINPIKYDTNCNTPIIEYLDKDYETRGKISYIPLEFLENFYKEKIGHLNINFSSNIEKKKVLINFLKQYLSNNNIDMNDFLSKSEFKGIKLVYCRKSFLKSEFSKTKDFSRHITIQDDLGLALNIPLGYNIKSGVLPQRHHKSTWLSSADIFNCIYPLTLIRENYDYFYLILFGKTDTNIAVVNSSMHKSNFDKRLKFSKKRFFIFPIIYNDHFTCCVIDKRNEKGKTIVYFFNSSGYIPEYIKLNDKYMFLEPDMKIRNHKKYKSLSTKIFYTYIDVLSKYIDDLIGVDYFILNTFEIQYNSPDCGMFNILFLYYLVYFKVESTFDFKKLYYSMSFIGDLLASSYRGTLFMSRYDISTLEDYKNNITVFNVKNDKFAELQDMYLKNLNRIEIIYNKIKREYSEYLETLTH